MTTKNLLYLALGSVTLFLLPSCADYGYYGYNGATHSSGSYGSSLRVLPHGYTRVTIGSTPYWHHGNRWYRHSGGRYIHCARPSGYRGSLRGDTGYSGYRYSRPHTSYSRPYSSRYRSSYANSSYHNRNHYSNLSNRSHFGNRGTYTSSHSRHSTKPSIRSGRGSNVNRSTPPRITPRAPRGNSGNRGTSTFVNTKPTKPAATSKAKSKSLYHKGSRIPQ
ncbi:MAG: hypothetical protein AB8F34_11825 [Akkermansiaceae bacterium]